MTDTFWEFVVWLMFQLDGIWTSVTDMSYTDVAIRLTQQNAAHHLIAFVVFIGIIVMWTFLATWVGLARKVLSPCGICVDGDDLEEQVRQMGKQRHCSGEWGLKCVLQVASSRSVPGGGGGGGEGGGGVNILHN